MRNLIFLCLFSFTPIFLFSQTTEKKNVWEPFNYFLGSWESKVTGKAGSGKGQRVYEFILGDKYLYCKNKSVFEPQEKNPAGEIHEDWTFFSYDQSRSKFIIRQFNIEGFVNQYVLDSLSTDCKTLVFVTESIENVPPGFRARLSHVIETDERFSEIFELAPSGKEFNICIKNSWKRIK